MTEREVVGNRVVMRAAAVVTVNPPGTSLESVRYIDLANVSGTRVWMPRRDGIRATGNELELMFNEAVASGVRDVEFVSLKFTNAAFESRIGVLFGPNSRVKSLKATHNVGHTLMMPTNVVALVDAVLAAPVNTLEELRIRTVGEMNDHVTSDALIRLINAGVLNVLQCGEERMPALIAAAMMSPSMRTLRLHHECQNASILQALLDNHPRPQDSGPLYVQAEGRGFLVDRGVVTCVERRE